MLVAVIDRCVSTLGRLHDFAVCVLGKNFDNKRNKRITKMFSVLKNFAVGKRRETEGLNKLTPAPEDPEWVKFMRTQTGFFSLLLWGGSILCFIGYGLKKEIDYLYLGIVLAFVVLVTGLFNVFPDLLKAVTFLLCWNKKVNKRQVLTPS